MTWGDLVVELVLERQAEKGPPGVDRRLEVREMKNQMGSKDHHLQSMAHYESYNFPTYKASRHTTIVPRIFNPISIQRKFNATELVGRSGSSK